MTEKMEIFVCDDEDCKLCMDAKRALKRSVFEYGVKLISTYELSQHPQCMKILDEIEGQTYHHLIFHWHNTSVCGLTAFMLIKCNIALAASEEETFMSHFDAGESE